MESNQFTQGLGAQQGDVAVGHQNGTGNGFLSIQSVQTDLNSAAGTGNLILVNDGYFRIESQNVLSNLIALVAHHNSKTLRIQIAGSGDSVLHHGTTTNTVHNLGGSGLHTRTAPAARTITAEGASSVFTGKTP